MINISKKDARSENMYFINHVYFFITILVIISNAVASHDSFYIQSMMSMLGDSASSVHNAISVISNAFIVPMMIFLFGFTVHTHIKSVGPKSFIKERAMTIAKFFLLSALIIMPLAYYLKFSNNGSRISLGSFISENYFKTWMVGPAWIFTMILFFDLIIFALRHFAKNLSDKIFNYTASTKVLTLFIVFACALFIVAVATKAPLGEFRILPTKHSDWMHFGPIWLQKNVLVTYFLIYAFSVCLGSSEELINYIFAPKGPLPSKWLYRFLETVIIYLVMRYIAHKEPDIQNDFLYHALMSLLSVLLIFVASAAFIGILDKFTKRKSAALAFLSENALLIYTVHFLPLIFIKNYLKRFPAIGEFQSTYIVVLFTLFVSLVLSMGIRKVPCFQGHCK